jgi:hypothetical protein
LLLLGKLVDWLQPTATSAHRSKLRML